MNRGRSTGVLAWMVLLLMALLAPAQRGSADAAKPTTRAFFWTVSEGGKTVYLLGSMHVAGKEMYPLPKEIEEAFAKASVLAVEVDMNKLDAGKMLTLVKEKGMYNNGDTLSKKLSGDTLAALKKYCADNQLPMASFETFRPWMASVTLQVVAIHKMGLDPNLGIDKHFLDAAKDKKRVEEFETADFQMDLISGLSDDMQDKMLRAALLEAGNLPDTIGKLRDSWMSGDTAGMQAMIRKGFDDKPELAVVEKKLITDRNVGMAEKIEAYLKGGEKAFVVVGAAHLIGEKGILKLLGDKGHKVEQVAVTPKAHAAQGP